MNILACVRALLLSHFSHVRLFVTLWTVAHQAPLSVGFSGQEYWRYTSLSLWKFLWFFFFFNGCAGSSLLCSGFLWFRWVRATSHWGAWASHWVDISCCRAHALSSRVSVVVALGLSSCVPQVLVALRYVESSWMRDRTHVPCIGRQILIYCTSREVLHEFLR